MLLARIEKLGDDYIIRIPRDEIAQRDLRDGQVVNVMLEQFVELQRLEAEPVERPYDNWKLNEPPEHYRPGE